MVDRWLGTKEEAAFERYSKLALKAASDLADYQSPKFSPVQLAAPTPDGAGHDREEVHHQHFRPQWAPGTAAH